ncbi:hypothetical protein [Streptomyces sp. NRRL F-4489]|uniref:hypothetical protein n=1 Tax=Streptomyces sp. NRRL F-4489 TaxID=1609095 RepID=UPI00131B5CF7|nr:hypothetical protein [Streptomyces sp. NRRL F-4489]
MTHISTDSRFPYEARCAEALREIEECQEWEVSVARFGSISEPLDDAEGVFEDLAKWHELPLAPEIRSRFFRFDEIEACWRIPRPENDIVGEFHLSHLYVTVEENRMGETWEGTDDEERELYGELRFFDDTPNTGSGRFAALRATPGASNPEIWFFDMRQGAIEMDLDYGTYLDTLLVTKGTIGWQYLFTDAGFGDPGFTPLAAGLREMMEVFPRLFPRHDYTDLRRRLEERL